ncbi:epoxyqueuosine reductase [Methanofollis fontis]|uniref:Epoxyqueuosine reductase n=1 Tax=Methanofollis fontis TaxID=2052832 RepID=A0A483CQL2_9EURY|nr:epoxyqueuosine reductase [Methanofollis fontis]TAJ45403.1 epoxyqueuosine reductase [Methanofollis fontis]
MDDLTTRIRGHLLENGASVAGIADLSPPGLSPELELRRAVVWGIALDPAVVRGLAAGPSEDYGREYSAVNRRLAALVPGVADLISGAGFRATAVDPTTAAFDMATLSAGFQHKTAATRAGLGWVGKCALLVTRRYGSAVRFASVLTDAPLTADTPIERSSCGPCEGCRTACPASAVSGLEWRPGLERDAFWDSRACHAHCRQVADELGLEHPMCGACIVACPWTQRYLAREE